MTQTCYASIEDFRTNLATHVDRVRFGNEQVIVSRYRRPAAVLIGYDEYHKLCAKKRKTEKKSK